MLGLLSRDMVRHVLRRTREEGLVKVEGWRETRGAQRAGARCFNSSNQC
jgi:hypothetical protein